MEEFTSRNKFWKDLQKDAENKIQNKKMMKQLKILIPIALLIGGILSFFIHLYGIIFYSLLLLVLIRSMPWGKEVSKEEIKKLAIEMGKKEKNELPAKIKELENITMKTDEIREKIKAMQKRFNILEDHFW